MERVLDRLRAWPGVGVAATALGFAVTLVSVRVWLPSILFIYARAGSTPATEMALFGLLPFVVALVVAVVGVRLAGPRRVALGAAVVLVAARLAIQASDGGDLQLVASTVAVMAGLTWLAATAAGAVARIAAVYGVAVGLALDAIAHAALRSTDLPWRPGLLPWLVTVVVALAFLAALWVGEESDREGGAGWIWLSVGPILGIHGIAAAPSRVHVLTGWPEWSVVLLVTIAEIGALAAFVAVVSVATRRASLAAVGATLLGLAVAASPESPLGTGPAAAAGYVLLAVGLGGLLGVVGFARGASRPSRRAGALVGGLFILFVVLFGYYAGYDMPLPVPGALFLGIGAAVLAVSAVLASPVEELLPAVRPAGALAAVGGVAAISLLLTVATPAFSAAHESVRVMVYNLHMGFNPDGRFDVASLADVIRSEEPDIVALNEVDRGWLTTGATDVLPRLAEDLGLPYVFAPAADEVWGNAILSRYPLRDVEHEFLPKEGTAMRRSVLWAVADLGDRELGVVVTHLHHVDEDGAVRAVQATGVAAVAERLRDSGVDVVVMGDLNAPPGSADLRPLESVLVNASAELGPPLTFPSWDPDETIDHILVSPGLAASELGVPRSQASDHLGVALTLRPAR
ncbi:MAG: endonuclease/exonuclease/phosphatase family protein [Nitriliruptorales bacterium]